MCIRDSHGPAPQRGLRRAVVAHRLGEAHGAAGHQNQMCIRDRSVPVIEGEAEQVVSLAPCFSQKRLVAGGPRPPEGDTLPVKLQQHFPVVLGDTQALHPGRGQRHPEALGLRPGCLLYTSRFDGYGSSVIITL